MTDKEKLKTFIERIINICDSYIEENPDTINIGIAISKKNVCKQILQFINSLQEEKISDDLEKAAESCMPECMWGVDVNGDGITENAYDFNQMIQMFKDGVDWQKEKMMKNAVDGEITVYVLSKHLKYDKGKFLNAWDRFNIGDKVKIIVIKED